MGMILIAAPAASASKPAVNHGDRHNPEAPTSSHLRTLDNRVVWLVATGLRYSPTFRATLDQINRSDVVAYIQFVDGLPSTLDGRTTFMVSSGGTRYVHVSLRTNMRAVKAVSMLAHELRHVLEVAHDPLIIDDTSMASEYVAHASVKMNGTTLAAETWQARFIAAQVSRELRSRDWALDLELEERRSARAVLPADGLTH